MSAAIALAATLAALVVLALPGAAGAQASDASDPSGPAVEASGADLPVTLGQPTARAIGGGWGEVGLAVPALLVFTTGMLCVGAGLLWRRCRENPHPVPAGDAVG